MPPTFDILPGGSGTIKITSKEGGGTTVDVDIAAPPVVVQPPVIVAQSVTTIDIAVGMTILLFVEATGDNLEYQWLKDAVGITGAKSPTYPKNATLDDTGDYTCDVYNSVGRVTTKPVKVVVNAVVVPPVPMPFAIIAQPYMDATGVLHIDTTGVSTWRWRQFVDPNMVDPTGVDNSKSSLAIKDGGTYDCIVKNAVGDELVSDRVAFIVQPPVVVPPDVPPVDPPVTPPPAGAAVLALITNNYPIKAQLAAPGQMEALLKQYGEVRLDGRTYGDSFKMQNNWKIWGWVPFTTLTGNVEIPDGVTGCVMSNLFQTNISGSGVVERNTFRHIKWGGITQNGGEFRNNLIYGGETSVQMKNAHMSGLRQFGMTKHGTSNPDVVDTVLHAPARGKSFGNVKVRDTAQSVPFGYDMENIDEFAVIGWDIEQTTQLVVARNCGGMRVFGLNGGGITPGASQGTGFTGGFDDLQLVSGGLGLDPDVIVTGALKRLFLCNVAQITVRGAPGKTYNENSKPADLVPVLAPVRIGTPWERAILAPLPAPKPEWLTPPKGYVNSSPALQAAINRDGITIWPEGVFYLDSPVQYGNNQGIVAGGKNKTFFVPTNQNNDVLVFKGGGVQPNGSPSTCAGHLSDFTIYGGRNQLLFNNRGDQVNSSTISFVGLIGAKGTAIKADKIYAFDNNFWDHVDIDGAAVGLQQVPAPGYTGGEPPDMAYIDKLTMFECTFRRCGKALDLVASRQNNLIAFPRCKFQNNSSVGNFAGNAAMVFTNSDFDSTGMLNYPSSGGDPTYALGLVSCNFTGPGPYLSGDVNMEGCRFDGPEGDIFLLPGKVVSLNTTPGKMRMVGTQLNPNGTPQFCFGTTMAFAA